jgi:hypothetical protein
MRLVPAVLLTAILTLGQTSTAPSKPPKAVVEEFWKMDTAGGRLTDEGWRASDHFFVHPIEPPKQKVICVFNYGFSVWDPKIQDSTAEVIVGTAGDVWKIEPSTHLSICSDQGKDFWVNKLVLTSKHWEFASDHKTLREVSGPREWRFEKPGSLIFLNIDTAIQYLTRVRDSTADPTIKKNAEESIATLKRNRGSRQ